MTLRRGVIVVVAVSCLAIACTATPGASTDTAGASPSTESAPSPTGSITDVAPEDVVGATWLGHLPGGEKVVGVVGDQTRLKVGEESFPIIGANGTVYIASLLGDGTTQVERLDADGSPLWTAVVDGDRYVGGASGSILALGGSTPDGSQDPGVILLDIETGAPIELLGAGPPPRDGSGWSRSILVSPSGSIVMSSLCGLSSGCTGQAFDLSGRTAVELDLDTPPLVATDTHAVAWDGSTASAVDLTSGKIVWQRGEDAFDAGYALHSDRAVIAWLTSSSTLRLEIVSLADGQARVVADDLGAGELHLWPELSTVNQAAVGAGGRLADVTLAGEPLVASVVALTDGSVTEDAIRIIEVDE